VGSIIVRPDKTVASLGFNGLPRGLVDTVERLHDRSVKLLMILHAETNALLSAKEPLNGYTLYVYPFHPCTNCASAIIQAGIGRVVTVPSDIARWEANFEMARMMFAEAGVDVSIVDLVNGDPHE
jgi:dCMP deaminase